MRPLEAGIQQRTRTTQSHKLITTNTILGIILSIERVCGRYPIPATNSIFAHPDNNNKITAHPSIHPEQH